ncbi:hypothetical protein D9619_002324 [Psilocybe cf. subviscida]|uniref:Uncharacterized protein n=1 Tax=Psilocybe cf. subviscida TaxID=2480587 RepID=A0A8H5ETN1_9AGAR|nr:hypothetical protein D9619_002324 [Psilocybe cf. subviscida]
MDKRVGSKEDLKVAPDLFVDYDLRSRVASKSLTTYPCPDFPRSGPPSHRIAHSPQPAANLKYLMFSRASNIHINGGNFANIPHLFLLRGGDMEWTNTAIWVAILDYRKKYPYNLPIGQPANVIHNVYIPPPQLTEVHGHQQMTHWAFPEPQHRSGYRCVVVFARS